MYSDRYIDAVDNASNDEILSITFNFSIYNEKKSIQIKNSLILSDIINSIRKGTETDPSISSGWVTMETDFKQAATENIFYFLYKPNSSWSMSNEPEIFVNEIISKIFQLADIDANHVLIKKWRQRIK